MSFLEKMLDSINQGALALMTAVGHQTGLFAVMAELPPSSSEEIASRAGLSQRYVREWLSVMVVGGVVTYDPEYRWYMLPREHAGVLAQLGPSTACLPLVAGLDKQFRQGGRPPLVTVARVCAARTPCAETLKKVLPFVPGLVSRLNSGIDVGVIGCGRSPLVAAFENSRFDRYDLHNGALPALLREQKHYHLITAFDSLRGAADPGRVLQRVQSALRDDGVLLLLEAAASSYLERNIGHPAGALLYSMSCMAGPIAGEEALRELLADAGFMRVEIRALPGDAQRSCFVVRK